MNLYKSGIIILILIMLWSVTAEAVKKEEIQPDIIRGFVEEVYNNYRSKKFENIYQVLYPGIKREVTKDEYIKFQNKNFQKYDLQISDISIDKVYYKNKLNSDFEPYLQYKESPKLDYFAEVEVYYEMDFTYLSRDFHREVEKKSFVGVKSNNSAELYLFWDPAPLEKE